MRKLAADLLFDGRALQRDLVLVLDDAGKVLDLIPMEAGEAGESGEAGDKGVEQFRGLLIPGLVNAHCHLELSHMAGALPEAPGLVPFLKSITRNRSTYPRERIRESMSEAEALMIREGIVAVGDIANGTDSLEIKAGGHLFYHTLVECIGFSPETTAERLASSLRIRDLFRKGTSLPATLVPHAPYSVSPPLLNLIASLEDNPLISIHNQESAAENEFFRSKTGELLSLYEQMGLDISWFQARGTSSLRALLPELGSQKNLILVHNTYTSQEDISLACQELRNLYWCLCPNTNLILEGRLPDIPLLRACGKPLILGTDSLASNRTLSLWQEMKTIQEYFPSIPLEEILGWATINGARALGIDDQYGSFAKGKKPGVVLAGGITHPESPISGTLRRIL